MSELTADCKPHCWNPVTCRVCGLTKKPYGRDVATAAAAGYCTHGCDGYWADPKPGHLWPDEAPAKKETEAQKLARWELERVCQECGCDAAQIPACMHCGWTLRS